MTAEQTGSKGRVLEGIVVSDKMDKTITVEVTRLVKHARYRKYISRSKNYKAHDENNEFSTGDRVVIRESRPLSKTKRWVVISQNAG